MGMGIVLIVSADAEKDVENGFPEESPGHEESVV